MRVRHWVLLGASSLFLSGILAGGCGGDSASNPPASDAGNDTTAPVDHSSPPVDTGPDIVDTGAVCVDADLNTINPPDASLADGATSVGICLHCARTACDQQIKACNADCDCKGIIVDFFDCLSKGGTLIQCGGPLVGGAVPPAATALGQCVLLGCRQECAPTPDAGPKDGSSDAAEGG